MDFASRPDEGLQLGTPIRRKVGPVQAEEVPESLHQRGLIPSAEELKEGVPRESGAGARHHARDLGEAAGVTWPVERIQQCAFTSCHLHSFAEDVHCVEPEETFWSHLDEHVPTIANHLRPPPLLTGDIDLNEDLLG